MLIRHALITFAICLVACPATAALIALYRHEWNLRAFATIYIYTAMGLTALGAMAGVAANSDGGGVHSVDSVSLNAAEFTRQDNQDAAHGMAFGWVLFLAGLLSFGGAYLLNKFVSV